MEMSSNSKRIPLKHAIEHDVHTGWRHLLCYVSRPRVCKYGKRSYNKRFRKDVKQRLKKDYDDV